MNKDRKAEVRRRLRELEKAALGCLAPAPKHNLVQIRQKKLDKKTEAVWSAATEFLCAVSRTDKKLAKHLQEHLYPLLTEWEAKEQERVGHLGDLRSLAR